MKETRRKSHAWNLSLEYITYFALRRNKCPHAAFDFGPPWRHYIYLSDDEEGSRWDRAFRLSTTCGSHYQEHVRLEMTMGERREEIIIKNSFGCVRILRTCFGLRGWHGGHHKWMRSIIKEKGRLYINICVYISSSVCMKWMKLDGNYCLLSRVTTSARWLSACGFGICISNSIVSRSKNHELCIVFPSVFFF